MRNLLRIKTWGQFRSKNRDLLISPLLVVQWTFALLFHDYKVHGFSFFPYVYKHIHIKINLSANCCQGGSCDMYLPASAKVLKNELGPQQTSSFHFMATLGHLPWSHHFPLQGSYDAGLKWFFFPPTKTTTATTMEKVFSLQRLCRTMQEKLADTAMCIRIYPDFLGIREAGPRGGSCGRRTLIAAPQHTSTAFPKKPLNITQLS